MIHIVFDLPNTTVWNDWVEECARRTEELKAQGAKDPYSVVIDDLYKRDSVRKSVFFALTGPFKGKCAFCEVWLESHFPDIEHYRPKKGVTDENDNVVEIQDDDGSTRKHPGYYWLAYDWKNLLPSCNKCNRPTAEGKMGKRNRFPIAGTRATKPSDPLKAEGPQILHPVFDRPENHFTVNFEEDGDDSLLIPTTDDGRMTLKVLGLNKRSDLREHRASAVLKFQALWALLARPKDREEAHRKLKNLCDGAGPGTLAVRILYDQIIDSIPVRPWSRDC